MQVFATLKDMLERVTLDHPYQVKGPPLFIKVWTHLIIYAHLFPYYPPHSVLIQN